MITLATDAFARTVGSGWGTPDSGPNWAFTNTVGAGSSSGVDSGSGQMTCPVTSDGAQHVAVASSNTDITATMWLPALPGGSGFYLGVTPRSNTSASYRARARVMASGTIVVQFLRNAGSGFDTAIGSPLTLGFSNSTGLKIRCRAQALGTSPTTLRARWWLDGNTEPGTWNLDLTDNTAGFQVPGGAGVWAYSATGNGTAVARYDDITVTDPDAIAFAGGAWGTRI